MRDADSAIERMTNALRHRGPDDGGQWVDQAAGIALGHRRLSIIDLSAEGHQPMFSRNGRYAISFNGEVYNYEELRSQLPGFAWRGHSDTEVMLAAIESWGLERAVKSFVGMFALALWDRGERKLYLVRDRLGIKPLYYGWYGKTFIFASELKAFKAYPGFVGEIDRDSLALFLRHNYIPSPYSIYKQIYKLRPGSILELDPELSREPRITTFWSARKVAEEGSANPFSGSEQEALEATHATLLEAIRLRMISDVPLGAFLSGGIDSSCVAALMQAQSSRPVKTFSIGFHEAAYNEAPYAAAVARHLGTDHTELYVTADEAMSVIPHLPTLYDEPFADSSQIPTFLVSQLARKKVTVSLSGDGGDELFGGYTRYLFGSGLWDRLQNKPVLLRVLAGKAITALSPEAWDTIISAAFSVLPKRMAVSSPGRQAHKLADLLLAESPETLYHKIISHWDSPEQIVKNGAEPLTAVTEHKQWANLPDFVQKMMYLDLVTYLPDDILTKVDRASMAVGLEARVPLLDHHGVEFAWRIPLNMKIRDGKGKWLLREVLKRYIPETLIERPKMGFGIPVGDWLRGPLREWGETLLAEKRLHDEGFFNPQPIREKWSEHLSGKRNWQYWLWDILVFQGWLEGADSTTPVSLLAPLSSEV